MTMNPLPPQAYTKDTLLKAYQWLTMQNSSIKEMATTPDILVSLYLKATRDGDSALDRPSIQNFKNELRNLAGIMGELDNRPSMATAPVAAAPTPNHHTPVVTSAPAMQHHQHQVSAQTQVSYTEKTLTATSRNADVMELLDSGSQNMIQEVKEEFNLSSDLEALRMLIKIGYNRSKGLLK